MARPSSVTRRVPVLVFGILSVALAAAQSSGEISGKFIGNGKEAKLVYAVAVPHDPWQKSKAYTLILSEKSTKGVAKPDFAVMFGELGDALVVGVNEKGDIFSTQVCHQGLKRSGFSSSGTLHVENFKIDGKELSARFYTKKKETFFDDSWEVDLTVKVVLP